MKTVFLRALEAEDKALALESAIRFPDRAMGKERFEVDIASFGDVPGSPFAYWLSERLRQLFKKLPPFEGNGRHVLGGLKTLSDERFIRAWWEAPAEKDSIWVAFAKGGAFSRFYADVYLRVKWTDQGREISWYGYQRRPREGFGATSRGVEAYFRPGITWPRRTQMFGVRVMPKDCIFGDKGPAAFVDGDDQESLLAFVALFSSKIVNALVEVNLNAADATARSYEVGIIQRIPTPHLNPPDIATLAGFSRRVWSLKKTLDSINETSNSFNLPVLLRSQETTLSRRALVCAERARKLETELSTIQTAIDDFCFELFAIHENDRTAILSSSANTTSPAGDTADADGEQPVTDEGIPSKSSDMANIVANLLSWATGTAFGRFDLLRACSQLPGSESHALDPFAPLPVCPPGVLQNEQAVALTKNDVQRLEAAGQWHYPIRIPWDGILVDDPDNANDIVRRVREVLSAIWKGQADSIEQESCEILELKDLREFFRKQPLFFADHLKRYSRSRRQGPIYWPLSTASGSYMLWVYYHRLNDDSLYTALNNYVKPKIDDTEKHLRRIESELPNATGREASSLRTAFEQAGVFLDELREFRDELARVADLPYRPNLNDGVLITASPLWKVFRLPKWRKDLQECYRNLERGDYDWAHLAYSIWPDRVRDVCKTDRSIAIAHDLESLCEVAAKPVKKKRSKKIGVEETVPGDEE